MAYFDTFVLPILCSVTSTYFKTLSVPLLNIFLFLFIDLNLIVVPQDAAAQLLCGRPGRGDHHPPSGQQVPGRAGGGGGVGSGGRHAAPRRHEDGAGVQGHRQHHLPPHHHRGGLSQQPPERLDASIGPPSTGGPKRSRLEVLQERGE